MNALIDELSWRGLIAHSTDLDALGAHLDEGPVKFYVGFDPTAQSVHTGNLVQLLLARDVPLPLIMSGLALLLGVTAEISSLHARLLPASLIAAIFTLLIFFIRRFEKVISLPATK